MRKTKLVLFFLMLLVPVQAFAYGLVDSYSGGNETGEASFYSNVWASQSFTATDSYSLASVKLDLTRSPTTMTGNVDADIYACDGDKPTGASLSSGSTDVNNVPEYPTVSLVEFLMSDLALTISTKYCVVLTYPSGFGGSLVVLRGDNGVGYGSGQTYVSNDSGANWTDNATDSHFETYSEAPPAEPTPTPTPNASSTLVLGDLIDEPQYYPFVFAAAILIFLFSFWTAARI